MKLGNPQASAVPPKKAMGASKIAGSSSGNAVGLFLDIGSLSQIIIVMAHCWALAALINGLK